MSQNDELELEYRIFERIAKEDMPIGAVSLHEMLEKNGFSLSVTGVSRLLRSYRKEGYLERVKNQGHILTCCGEERRRHLASEMALHETMKELTETENGDPAEKILGILTARRAIEVEASYRAALNATKEDIAKMDAIIRQQYLEMERDEDYSSESANFHRAVLDAAKVPLLVTLYNFIGLSNQWQHFFVGTFKLYNTPTNLPHEEILRAIEKRDAEQAARLMSDHMDKVIRNAEKLILKK